MEEGFVQPSYVHSTEHETVQMVRETAVLPPWEEKQQQLSSTSDEEQETQLLEQEEESMNDEAIEFLEETSEVDSTFAIPCTSHGQTGSCLPKGGCNGQTVAGLCPGTTVCCFAASGVIVSPLNLPTEHRAVGGVLSIDYRSILSPIKDQGQLQSRDKNITLCLDEFMLILVFQSFVGCHRPMR